MQWASTPVVPLSLNRNGSRKNSIVGTSEFELQHQLIKQRMELRTFRKNSCSPVQLREILRVLNQWVAFAVMVILVTSQFACLFWSLQTTSQYMMYGEDPTKGPHAIEGNNDEPYSDRCLVCVRQGRLYRPMQLSAVLVSSRAEATDTTGSAISGYRIVRRQDINLRDEVAKRYELTCGMLAATLEKIEASCRALGYEIGNEELHIVDGIFSNVTWRINGSLVIMPYWDNAIFARYALPGRDGNACIFQLSGLFDSSLENGAWLRGINRTVRESKTTQWLRIPPNRKIMWRNGWLEDSVSNQRWYSALGGSLPRANDKCGLSERQFDLLAATEIDCTTASPLCRSPPIPEWWGDKFYSIDSRRWYNSVAVSNGTRYGLFLYEAMHDSIIHSVYDIATLISNTTIGILLFRWLAAIVVFSNAYRRGYTQGFSAPGVGCLACTRSFELLPILLLPRMTNALAAFFTAGCKFEGEQRPLSEAWFVVYPAIAEVMLYYYSVLNLVAKFLRRRMSDELFGPSLVTLCLLHWLRRPLAISGILEFDGRVATVMTAKEYENLHLVDFFSSDVALRMNGNIWSIFGFKLGVLGISLLPLVFATKLSRQEWPWVEASRVMTQMTTVERALGIRAAEIGGLGVSTIYCEPSDHCWDGKRRRLSCYELVRLGYVVYGDVVVMSLTDWLLIALYTLLRSRKRVSNLRVLTYRVQLKTTDAQRQGKSYYLEVDGEAPTFYQTHDPIILDTNVWDIAAIALP